MSTSTEVQNDYREKRIHIIFGDNTTPELDANEIENNYVIDSFVLDEDAFLEDFEAEFKIKLSAEVFNSFVTVGDIVRWTEAQDIA